tara:strand:- start:739 stop:915 length:177 start_codon:yes stop_codon:yes gene_type:complete
MTTQKVFPVHVTAPVCLRIAWGRKRANSAKKKKVDGRRETKGKKRGMKPQSSATIIEG